LVYSTYLGGSGSDVGNAIAVDAAGNALLTGVTTSTNFTTTTYFGPPGGGAFVTKFNPSGSFVYSTILGGSGGNGIAVNAAGNAYVAGYTTSPDFPTKNPLQPALRGSRNAFVAELTVDGSALVYSTYLGGSTDDWGFGIAVDA